MTGIFLAIAGLLILGITMCCILKRKSVEGRGYRHSGGTRTARGRNRERQSHHGRGGRHHGGSRRSSARVREQVCSLAGLPRIIGKQVPIAGIKSGIDPE